MTTILAIESSCDETAAAVVRDRDEVLSNVIASQIDIHREYGGVVPELAARHHIEAIDFVLRQALLQADTRLEEIDAIAVTQGPGLIGSLLVGVMTAKAIAWQRQLPLIAVNHLEGHVRSVFIDHPATPFPNLSLIVSGGHTALYLCPGEGDYRLLARTRDDAVGEAFDKVSKLLGLGYPGGPVIERIARDGNSSRHDFPHAQMKDGSLDFSYSGLKTAVRREAQRLGLDQESATGGEVSDDVRDIAASFQRAAIRVLVRRTVKACKREGVDTVAVSGGVSCNKKLRESFAGAAAREGLQVVFPAPQYTTDNAAMIGAAAFLHYERGEFAPLSINADPSMKL
ncbi:MAG: tRNA (adenosine(37)-N6)-threonylcarbamoyltransferase complex transferase subunit TsaD [Acidobacteriota bacterium]|nr:tRNA (adenosine(37)-N6)-threonylcarbamoyltransferase complex transferase subunit TsaD [Acidobacteriota bacterium]MDH3784467.1 tRNA (adenosine(37)-N6)-threonylcarbamoyltransferase complex transferase subunit TsaD [Acidobacteriota bacterium]